MGRYVLNKNHPLNIGKVAWWLIRPDNYGSNRLIDIVGQNHGTLTNMTTAASGWRGTTRLGGLGSLLFDGVDDYVNCGSSRTLNARADFTLGASFLASSSSSPPNRIAGKRGAESSWYSTYLDSAGHIVLELSASSSVGNNTNYLDNLSHRLIVSRIGSLNTVYIDGQIVSTLSNSSDLSNTGNFVIGAFPPTPTVQPFSGKMNNIFFSTRAWSSAEVQADYLLGQQGYPGLFNYLSRVMYSIPNTFAGAPYYYRLLQGAA